MAEAYWYVAHTYSGYEKKVKANIEKTIENRKLQDQILEVAVPEQDAMEKSKSGDMKKVKHKVYPGYVLVHMVMNEETWYVIRNTRGVTGFVGPGSKPVPLTDVEIRNMGLALEPKIELDCAVGDLVTVVSGVWENTQGVVQAINEHKQCVIINIDMFGRETPVEISFADVKVEN